MRPVSELDRQEWQQPGVPKLLIVEDEISTVFAMREFFSFNGYQVDCAPGETEAISDAARRYDRFKVLSLP